jgi:hypothetical protein
MISTIFKTISCIFKILFLYPKYLVDYLKKNKKNNKKWQIFVCFLINCQNLIYNKNPNFIYKILILFSRYLVNIQGTKLTFEGT